MITLYRLNRKVKLDDGTKYPKGYVLTLGELKLIQEEYRTLHVTVISIPREFQNDK